MPTFRHYALRKAMPVKPVDGNGAPVPKSIEWETEWADPSPSSHTIPGASYIRVNSDGYSVHELSGVRIQGMKPGDLYQVQIVILDSEGKEILWHHVVEEGEATPGYEHFSTVRTLRSKRRQRVRWRFLYYGKETDVKVVRADWLIREY